MKNNAKALSFIIIIIILLNICTSCNSKSGSTNINDNSGLKQVDKSNDRAMTNVDNGINKNEEDTQCDELKNTKGTTPLRLYLYGTKPEGFDEVASQIEKESGLNIQLDFKWFRDDKFNYNVITSFASGNVDGYATYGIFNLADHCRKDRFKDIKDLLPKYSPDIHNQLKDKGLLSLIELEGNSVLLPSLYNRPYNWFVHIKKEYVNKYNIKEINTIEDYIMILDNIKQDKGKVSCYFWSGYLLELFATINDYVVLDEGYQLLYKRNDTNMQIKAIEELEEYKPLAMLINEAYRKGLFTGTSIEKLDYDSSIYINNTIIESNKYAISINDETSQEDSNVDDYCVFNMYSSKDTYANVSLERGKGLVLDYQSNNIESVLKFMNWIHSNQEAYDLINYGIKDKHYELKGNKINRMVDMRICDAFMNDKYERMDIKSQEYDRTKINDVPFIVPPHIGFKAKKTPFSRGEILWKSLQKSIVNEELNSELWNKIMEELKTKGTVEKVKAEFQKQLNEWRESCNQ